MQVAHTMHDFQLRSKVCSVRWCVCRSSKQCQIKQILDSVFVISRIIKVSVSVTSLGLRLG